MRARARIKRDTSYKDKIHYSLNKQIEIQDLKFKKPQKKERKKKKKEEED